jgi:flagellar biosynthesis protein FlhG
MIDQAEQLRLLARPAPASSTGARSGQPYTIAVTSGKGGVGKTNIAANLGVLLSSHGRRTAILDADLGLSNVEVLLGCPARYNLGDVLSGGMSIRDVCVEGPAGVRMISAGSGIEWLANLTPSERSDLIARLFSSDLRIDALVIDTSPGISSDVTDFLQIADEILVVTTPEPTALTDSYALMKIVFRAGLRGRTELIVNEAPDRQAAEKTASSMSSICTRFLGRSFDAWDWIPLDPSVPAAVSRQQPVVELYPASGMSGRLRAASIDMGSRMASQRRTAGR